MDDVRKFRLNDNVVKQTELDAPVGTSGKSVSTVFAARATIILEANRFEWKTPSRERLKSVLGEIYADGHNCHCCVCPSTE